MNFHCFSLPKAYPQQIPENAWRFFRFVFCLSLAFGIYSYAFGYDLFIASVAAAPNDLPFYATNIQSYQILRYALFLLLALTALGLGGRLIPWFALAVFAAYEFPVATALHPYSTNFAFFTFAALCATTHKLRTTAPFYYAQIAISLLYFSSAATKVFKNGSLWLSGGALQHFMAESHLFTDTGISAALSSQKFLLIGASWAIFLFEGFFALSLLGRHFAFFFMTAGFALHVAIFWIMKINFFHFLVPAYLCFLPWIWQRK